MEWQLFDDRPAEPLDTLINRGWMDLEGQPGFAQRAKLVTDLAGLMLALLPDVLTVTDMGCGDGSLLARLGLGPRAWGYEIGAGDVAYGLSRGLDVQRANIVADRLEYGDLLIASEVLEHLADPVGFLKGLPDRLLIVSSPSAETGKWHNPIHSWAWDLDGYRDLVERSGWRVLYQAECDGGTNVFAGVAGPQRFQAIVAAR